MCLASYRVPSSVIVLPALSWQAYRQHAGSLTRCFTWRLATVLFLYTCTYHNALVRLTKCLSPGSTVLAFAEVHVVIFCIQVSRLRLYVYVCLSCLHMRRSVTCLAHYIVLYLVTLITFGGESRLQNSSLFISLHLPVSFLFLTPIILITLPINTCNPCSPLKSRVSDFGNFKHNKI